VQTTPLPAGRSFQPVRYVVDGADQPIERSGVLTFTEISLHIGGGCNSSSASARIEDRTLVTSDYTSTAMACERSKMESDGRLSSMTSARPTFALTGGDLVLMTANKTLYLRDTEDLRT
jgi:heat shock protein HslJ